MIEVVIAVAIISLAFLGLVTIYGHYVKASLNVHSEIRAAYLIEEGQEAVRMLRDMSWTANIAPLSTAVQYQMIFSSTTGWSLTPNAQPIAGGFYRTVQIQDVSRDNQNDIAASGTVDPNTKRVNVTVYWAQGTATSSKQISTYIANIFGN